MFHINENIFFQKYSAVYGLTAGDAIGLGQLLGKLAQDVDIVDLRWAAYVLATVKHECADVWHPIEEFGRGKGKAYGVPIIVTDTAGKQYSNTYYGRGYVQLTWKNNYERLGKALGLGEDLMYHPEKALAVDIAYQIASYGMRRGAFTGRKLADFIHGESCDYTRARQIINGNDSAGKIAEYARNIEMVLHTSAA